MTLWLAAILSVALAQPARGPEYPQPGSDLPGPFHAYNVTGKKKGTFHCLVSRHDLNPVVMVVVRGTKLTDELKYLLTKIDNAVDKNFRSRLAAFVVFLPENVKDVAREDDAREKIEAELEDQLKELKHVTVAFDAREKLGKYKIDDQAEAFVLLYNQYRVVSAHSLTKDQLTMDKVKAILGEVAEKLGARRG